ncbi:hypothetical protein OCU04_006424 [Sclerotinia nivalis]|uniref:Uncharacterized protein n=1 Tax=Sclerotinia nivalis TaxID=352851 RepID=A0A9X0ANS8_9HELO|nr:hypothetical protein OCU04_006424 [Sclerotinia nivalis]
MENARAGRQQLQAVGKFVPISPSTCRLTSPDPWIAYLTYLTASTFCQRCFSRNLTKAILQESSNRQYEDFSAFQLVISHIFKLPYHLLENQLRLPAMVMSFSSAGHYFTHLHRDGCRLCRGLITFCQRSVNFICCYLKSIWIHQEWCLENVFKKVEELVSLAKLSLAETNSQTLDAGNERLLKDFIPLFKRHQESIYFFSLYCSLDMGRDAASDAVGDISEDQRPSIRCTYGRTSLVLSSHPGGEG